ncbi:hypothetical protein NL50_13075 [Clostridium acetobutylicum]|nr:hypothetical protein NL50_13075 [Clostridium acetobutylicum]
MFEERVKKILKRAGWYENRNIDITAYIKVLENSEYEVFDAAKKFLQEFGELKIIARYIDSFDDEEECEIHLTSLEDMKYCYERNLNYDDKVGEKTIPICKLYQGEYIVCISESGEFFVSEGLWAKDSEDFWNGLWGEYKGGFLDWVDYKEGKEYKILKYKNKNYL